MVCSSPDICNQDWHQLRPFVLRYFDGSDWWDKLRSGLACTSIFRSQSLQGQLLYSRSGAWVNLLKPASLQLTQTSIISGGEGVLESYTSSSPYMRLSCLVCEFLGEGGEIDRLRDKLICGTLLSLISGERILTKSTSAACKSCCSAFWRVGASIESLANPQDRIKELITWWTHLLRACSLAPDLHSSSKSSKSLIGGNTTRCSSFTKHD